MAQHYSDLTRASETYALPDVETFYVKSATAERRKATASEDEGPTESGWYYWYCFPGCLPDGDAIGPFATEQEAIDAMRAEAEA